MIMRENFRPLALGSASGRLGKLQFICRMALDLQVATIYRTIRQVAREFSGTVLDVGCGASPYKFLFDGKKANYVGIDIVDADRFDYKNSEVICFNGRDIPFPDAYCDGVLCTEVLEHVHDYQALIDEIRRVMKPGALFVLTVPWSARFHYIPHDFFRYTPSALELIFKDFKDVKIISRGTDATSIVAKILVIWFRNLVPGKGHFNGFTFLFSALCIPLAILLAGVGHLSILLSIGSTDDPLGYSVTAVK